MALRLKFMSAVLRKADVADYYPGGRAAFESRHQAALEDDELYGLVSMNWRDVEDRLDQLYLEGFDPDIFVAVADSGYGPVTEARSIRFAVIDGEPMPCWSAEGPKLPMAPPTFPKPPVPVSSPRYRPHDYFGRLDQEAELLTRIKGHARRIAVKDALENGELDQLPDHVKAAELTESVRQGIGRVHPFFMGGEYLSGRVESEIEIARVSIKSTTYDVTAVYACLKEGRIHYRVVDEYGGDTLDSVTTMTSIRPLTMGQMTEFFLQAWDMMAVLADNFGDDVDRMLDFFEGQSAFYPCFDALLRNQVQRHFIDDTPEEDDGFLHPAEAIAARLTPEFLAAISADDSEEARQAAKKSIVSHSAWWACVTSNDSDSKVPVELRECLSRFAASLPELQGAISGMARMAKLARLRSRARLYWHLNGQVPDAGRLKRLFNLR